MEISRQHVESVIRNYLKTYIEGNRAALALCEHLDSAGVGLWPVIDHLSFRTSSVVDRVREFDALGFNFDDRLGVVERDSYWYKAYRRPGFPTIIIQQAFPDARGAASPIPAWVQRHTDGPVHHIGVVVDSVEKAMTSMKRIGLEFINGPSGDRESEYRQAYTVPEMRDGQPFTILEIVERRWGFAGFLPTPIPDPVPAPLDPHDS